MKATLEAIKSHLQGDANLSYITDTNIFIVPDENIIPISVTFPALGIKDGAIERDLEMRNWDVSRGVTIIVYQTLTAGETPIIGQADPKIYGVLEISEDVYLSLNGNNLSLSGVYDVRCPSETESETIGFKDLILQKKKLYFEYSKTEADT